MASGQMQLALKATSFVANNDKVSASGVHLEEVQEQRGYKESLPEETRRHRSTPKPQFTLTSRFTERCGEPSSSTHAALG